MSASVVNEHRPTRINRSKAAPLCERCVVRMQVSNTPEAENCSTTGVEGAPKSSKGSTVWNVETQFRLPLGRLTARHAVGGLEQDAKRSECLAVMVRISRRVQDSVRRQTFSGSPVT